MHQTIYTLHGHNDHKVERVMREMVEIGAPTIRVVDCGDHYIALEGVHRLAAAARLGIAPTLVALAQDDMVAADSLDWQDLMPGESYTAGELAAEVYSAGSGEYRLADDGTVSLVAGGAFVPADDAA